MSTEKKGSVKVSYAKLRGKIREVFGRQQDFAMAMGMDNATLSAKLNNKTDWKREEIEKACQLLNIPTCEIHKYFFCI